MNREQLAEDLDRQVDELIAGQQPGDPSSLLWIADELRLLPSEDFRQALKAGLVEEAEALQVGSDMEFPDARDFPLNTPELGPTLSQQQFGALPADPRSLVLSFASHAAVVALIASGIWVGHQTVIKPPTLISEVTHIVLPEGADVPHGGGGGGDRSAVRASRGTPPKFSDKQLAPPVIVVRNPSPKLQADPTVLGPPQLKLPQSNQIGDLFSSNVTIPSNGVGRGGGVGDNSGTGVGIGNGPGVGAGRDGGFGGEVFRPGTGISAPRAIYDPDPEYSDEARKAKFQGNVVLALIVDATGRVRDIQVARSLGMGLDEKAIEAVRKWRFEPGMKDGQAVAVQVNVEVNFRLY